MKHITLKLMATATMIAAIAALSGCAEKKPEIDFNLIGGTLQTEDSDYEVDIRSDTEETPVNSDTEAGSVTAEPEIFYDSDIPKEEIAVSEADESDIPEAPTVSEDKPDTTKPETTTTAAQPAVTITTDKPQVTTPAQTVRTDLPKVTAEPQYTTAATTTTKPAKQTEPAEIQTDANGFPANPQNGDKFTDSTGQTYQYDGSLFFRWVPYNNDGKTIVQEFPTFEVEGGDEIILH